jgi:hypothetical protein
VTGLLDQAARIGIHPHPSDDIESGTQEDQAGGPGLGDYLSWLAEDLTAAALNPGTFGVLGLALGELHTHSGVTALPRNHGLRRSLAAADHLRADYAELRADPTDPPTP